VRQWWLVVCWFIDTVKYNGLLRLIMCDLAEVGGALCLRGLQMCDLSEVGGF